MKKARVCLPSLTEVIDHYLLCNDVEIVFLALPPSPTPNILLRTVLFGETHLILKKGFTGLFFSLLKGYNRLGWDEEACRGCPSPPRTPRMPSRASAPPVCILVKLHTWRNGHRNDLKPHPFPDHLYLITPTSPGSETRLSNPDPKSLPARASQQFKELLSAGSFQIDRFLETHKKPNTRKEGISESHPLGWQLVLGSFKY